MPVGLFGEQRNVIAGCGLGEHAAHLVEVEGEVGGALALDDAGAGEAGDVAVQRVGRLEDQRRCGRARRRSGSSVCSTSFEPLAAKTCSGATPWRAAMASRSSVAARSG